MPFYERVLHVVRKHVTPVWTRSFPVSNEPTTLGEHLRKKRFSAGLRQSQVAQLLEVSSRTLSLWETDRVYPAWAFQRRLSTYLGYDPFTDPTLGRPRGNERRTVKCPANRKVRRAKSRIIWGGFPRRFSIALWTGNCGHDLEERVEERALAVRFRPSPPHKTPVNTGFYWSWESEFHRNLHLFGRPFRNWSLLGQRSPTAR